jgi:hypothetical protein
MIVKESQLNQSQQSQDYPMFLSAEQREQLFKDKFARAVLAMQRKKQDHKDVEHS